MSAFALALALGLAQNPVPTDFDAEFTTALGTVGLTAETARFDPNLLRFFEQGEFRTPFFLSAHENVWRMPFFAQMFRRQLASLPGRPADALSAGAHMAGFGVRRGLLGDPIRRAREAALRPGSLRAALDRMREQGLLRGEEPPLGNVPVAAQQAAALLVEVSLEMIAYRRAALLRVENQGAVFDEVLKAEPRMEDPVWTARERDLLARIDLRLLMAAAYDLAHAATEAEVLVRTVSPTQRYDWRVETVWGEIVLTGGSDSSHGERPAFVLIDTGGNDTYRNLPATRSVANWVSTVVDTAGNDRYLSDERLAETRIAEFAERRNNRGSLGPGGAVLGFAQLVDSQGDDLYRSHRSGLAAATFGAATLLDRAGDDVYEAYADALAFARFGGAILEDLAGDDSYYGFTQVQGIGLTGGVGLLVDRQGKDRYTAEDTIIEFPSPQSAQHNVSMAQGCGFGRRADYLDAHSLSGGIGILYDQAGDDTYAAGVFAQGVGYWEGIGCLWDDAGNDSYTGQWYVQGASAHFAIGYLEDGDGNDTYTALLNMAQGAGHDFGSGYLIDRGGDDRYQAPNLSLGAGNANGIGVFVDVAGDDTYASSGITLGRGAEAPKGSLRERALTLGVFMDLGGTDTYPPGVDYARNGSRIANWTDRKRQPSESQVGVFWDR